MIYDLFFLILTLRLFDDDPVLTHLKKAAFDPGPVLKDQLDLPTDILPVLPVQFQRLIQTGGRDFERKVAVWEKSAVFQLFIKSPVELDAFLDRDALVAVDV